MSATTGDRESNPSLREFQDMQQAMLPFLRDSIRQDFQAAIDRQTVELKAHNEQLAQVNRHRIDGHDARLDQIDVHLASTDSRVVTLETKDNQRSGVWWALCVMGGIFAAVTVGVGTILGRAQDWFRK